MSDTATATAVLDPEVSTEVRTIADAYLNEIDTHVNGEIISVWMGDVSLGTRIHPDWEGAIFIFTVEKNGTVTRHHVGEWSSSPGRDVIGNLYYGQITAVTAEILTWLSENFANQRAVTGAPVDRQVNIRKIR